jgi:nucleoid-associated protein YgaU
MTMAKLKLLVWWIGVGAAAWWSLGNLSWPAEDPAAQAMTVVRVVAGALAGYLFVVTALAVRMPRVAPRFVRRLVAGAVGTALLVAPMTATASTGTDVRPPATEAPVLRRVTEPEPPPEDTNLVDLAGPEPANSTRFVTVEPGGHLWGIAARELEGRLGRVPTDGEVAPFWRALIAANDGRLQSGDPDLVFPGETVRLPS